MLLFSLFLDGQGLHPMDQEFMVQDAISHRVLAMMRMGARQEALLWIWASMWAGVPGLGEVILPAARWWLWSSLVSGITSFQYETKETKRKYLADGFDTISLSSYKCPVCNDVFNDYPGIMEHFEEKHFNGNQCGDSC